MAWDDNVIAGDGGVDVSDGDDGDTIGWLWHSFYDVVVMVWWQCGYADGDDDDDDGNGGDGGDGDGSDDGDDSDVVQSCLLCCWLPYIAASFTGFKYHPCE